MIVILGLLFGFWQFNRVKKLKAHKSMLEIGNVIFKTCSTYLKQQGKFLFFLFLIIGAAIALYFGALANKSFGDEIRDVASMLSAAMDACTGREKNIRRIGAE